jgi:hypothetical protein
MLQNCKHEEKEEEEEANTHPSFPTHVTGARIHIQKYIKKSFERCVTFPNGHTMYLHFLCLGYIEITCKTVVFQMHTLSYT